MESRQGTLFIIATPIGNLEDITFRAIRVLKESDLILCEDTRHTAQLLNHFEIKRPLLSYHQHSTVQKVDEIIQYLREGKSLALVSDAGTPGISDPGGVLIHQVVQALGESVRIVPIPGASALATMISVAGVPMDKFVFFGFLPHKKGRQTLFQEIAESERTVIFYESTHRIIKALESLVSVLAPDRQIVVGRELTKQFETIYRGSAAEVLTALQADVVKGEFVVVVSGK
ncbi:MAG: 16S rRNA (cytidine(1402)-2'-O)-methyltransferase [Candidatus Kerfeldbacteria bacterium]|nr:16S rRNA (cytidine(1402)-2'-O)-methyltransferase [Candidatus Kerfeldbacteria bacterium]